MGLIDPSLSFQFRYHLSISSDSSIRIYRTESLATYSKTIIRHGGSLSAPGACATSYNLICQIA